MNNIYYSAEEWSDLIENLEICFSQYSDKAAKLSDSYSKFIDNETYLGEEAEASKGFVNTIELAFVERKLSMHQKLLDMYRHSYASFAEQVDSADDARLDLETLDTIEDELKSIYVSLDSLASEIEIIADNLNRGYGEVCSFCRPDFRMSREGLADLCGGDVRNAGFYHDLKEKFIQYNEDESAYIQRQGFLNELQTENDKINEISQMLEGFSVGSIAVNTISLKTLAKSKKNGISGTVACADPKILRCATMDSGALIPLYQEISAFLAALGYAAAQIEEVWGIIVACAACDGPLPIGDIIAVGIGIIAAIAVIAMAVNYFAKQKAKTKSKEKNKSQENDKENNARKEKPHRRNKKGEPLGKNGPQIDSAKVWRNGKTERIEVENPKPGKTGGNIHYHAPDGIKYVFDVVTGLLYNDKTGEVAPQYIQKILERPDIQRAINKGLHMLCEDPYF